MWGNRLGWSISCVIALVMITLMVMLERSGTQPSGMTPKFAAELPQYLAPFAMSPAPETILQNMTEDRDAADIYREAIALYEKSPALYASFNPKTANELEAVDKIVEATNCKSMTLFAKDPGRVINFESVKPPIEALRKIGESAANKALTLRAGKDPDGARRYAEAAFALGAKMLNERIVYEEFDAGLGIMGAASGVLIRLANDNGDTGRADQIKNFNDARMKLSDKNGRTFDLHRITKTRDGDISAMRAGDLFVLARRSQERMWRVEACLQLARTHRNVGDDGRAADQRFAQALLVKLANDPDLAVKTAAARARDITDPEYNRQQ